MQCTYDCGSSWDADVEYVFKVWKQIIGLALNQINTAHECQKLKGPLWFSKFPSSLFSLCCVRVNLTDFDRLLEQHKCKV